MADDYTDDTQTTGAVVVGGLATGNIETRVDRDWFAVTLVDGHTYQFDLEGTWTFAGTLHNTYLHGIYDAHGNLIEDTTNIFGGVGTNSRVTFTATEDATYYVSAGVFDNRKGSATGTYTLSVRDVTQGIPDDYTEDTQTTGAVAVGGSATGEIESNGDRDWFAVTLEADKYYRLDLDSSGNSRGTMRYPHLRGVYDANGNRIEEGGNSVNGTGNSRVVFAATAAGTYYVSAGADRDGEGAYTLSVTAVTDSVSDDFTVRTDTTGRVTVGSSATGQIDFWGDRDWFAVTLEAGKSYQFDLTASGANPMYNPYLYGIYDAAGARIEGTWNDNGGGGRDSRVTFNATESGTYYVSAGEYHGYRPTGTYSLSVRDVTDDPSTDLTAGLRTNTDLTAGLRTNGAVDVGGSATSEIESSGDRDWFAVTLEAGTSYRFDLEGYGTERGTLRNPYLHGIYDAEGNLLDGTTNDNGGVITNSRVTFTATAGGTYYVSAGTAGGPGTYALSVRDLTDDFTAEPGTSGAVDVGGSVTAEIETEHDRDWFEVTLDAGKAYRFDLEGTSASALFADARFDPYLYGIYNAAGNLINGTTDNDGGSGRNSRVAFTATEGATYYVSAGAHADDLGTYALSVTEFPDDFTAEPGTSGAVAVGESATGEIESSGDRDWFAVTLEAGNIYRFDLEGTGAGALIDPYLYGIYDAAGKLIAGTTNDDSGSGRNSRVTFRATDAATYYVSAGAYGRREGAYTLSVTDVTNSFSDDFTAETGTTGRITADGSAATGGIDFEGDRDWFAVTLDAGKTYRFDLEGSGVNRGTLWDPYLYGIYDAAGNPINGTTDDDGGSGYNSRVTFTATDAATYYVSAGAYEDNLGTYTLSVEEVM